MDHSFVTIVLPFDTDRVEQVEACIGQVLGNPVRGDLQDLLDNTGIVHFASVVVAPSSGDQRSHLVIEASSDGTQAQGIGALTAALDEPLQQILAEAGIPVGGGMCSFLSAHSLFIGQAWWETLGLPFAGTPGMTCNRICAEDRLAKTVQDVLDAVPHTRSAFSRLEAARNALWARGDTKWAFQPETARCLEGPADTGLTPLVRPFFGDALPNRPFDLRLAAKTITRVLWAALVSFGWPFLLAFVLLVGIFTRWFSWPASLALAATAFAVGFVLVLLRLRHLEIVNTPVDREPGEGDVEQIMKRETWTEQNLLYSVSTLRGGLLTRLVLRVALFSVGASRFFCRPGLLGSNSVIHFARWFVIPGTDQLVFLSNYDGTWQGYVGDFVLNRAGSRGVTSIWSNCVGFPRTRLLVGEGAADRDRLVRWARRQQRPVPFWYSRYPRTTTTRIRTHAAIRQGLASATTAQDAADWLACFGSAPRRATDLEFAEIPALAFGGFSRLHESAVAAFRLSDSPQPCRDWLRRLEARVSYGEDADRECACVVALSAHGLAKLDLPADAMATFPVAFQQGMDAPERARANGDVGISQEPAAWSWGHGAAASDVLVVLYARDRKTLDTLLDTVSDEAARLGHARIFEQCLKGLPRRRLPVEAFGFIDGISQPGIRGARRSGTAAGDSVAPGEFILGYADELGRYPSTPTIDSPRDPDRLLFDAGVVPDRQRPRFAPGDGASRRDLGRNGTYLVVRQLEQHDQAFKNWLRVEAQRLHALDGWWDEDKLAAKLIGRWKNGTSLVRHPQRPGPLRTTAKGPRPDNDFLYLDEDATGAACPLGAHIRRANPRDGLSPGTPETHASVQTHRLLRVGRSYEATTGAKGIMFMCIAADIERQFEFVQQRWLLNPSFEGLQGETDPLLGRCPVAQPAGRTFSIPCPAGSRRAQGMMDFVTMRGGGYFFVPSRAALGVLSRL